MTRVLLAVTGGIAVYKAVDVASRLTKAGVAVFTAMTENATRFVTPLTFRTVTGNRVVTSMWADGAAAEPVEHVELAQSVALVVVCPATANVLAKRAMGLADDFVSTALVATTAPVLFCPAMNDAMWANGAVQRNVERLRADGCTVLEPATGRLACGRAGQGRLPEPAEVVAAVLDLLARGGGVP